jgi:hypothetical protein
MAIAPAYHMSRQMPAGLEALPVLKVLYRNTSCMHGGHAVLHAVKPGSASSRDSGGEALRVAARQKDLNSAEAIFAALTERSADEAYQHLLYEVQDDTEVHRAVLPYRAWDLLGIIGKEHAHTLLRNSLRYCLMAEGRWTNKTVRPLLPKVLEEHHLLDSPLGRRKAEDAWMDKFSFELISSKPEQAAHAVAAALAEGIDPADIGECLTLAANQLLLRDAGRPPEQESEDKLAGSVHGNSVGVHSCDAANAWRNMATVGDPRSVCSCLILGGFQVAWDCVGGSMSHYTTDFLHREALPTEANLKEVGSTDPTKLLRQAENAIRHNMQAHACAIIAKYGQLGHDPKAAFDLMLRYAVSEDGSLHGEKFYQTSYEEFNRTRPTLRWRHVIGCARVTASEYGQPAPGVAEASDLLKS